MLMKFVARNKFFCIGTFTLIIALGGCGNSERRVRYSVTAPGGRAGDISYVHKKNITLIKHGVWLPWFTDFKAHDGQNLSITFQAVPLQSNVPGLAPPDTNVRYGVEIWVENNQGDLELVCRKDVQGVGQSVSCSAEVGKTTAP